MAKKKKSQEQKQQCKRARKRKQERNKKARERRKHLPEQKRDRERRWLTELASARFDSLEERPRPEELSSLTTEELEAALSQLEKIPVVPFSMQMAIDLVPTHGWEACPGLVLHPDYGCEYTDWDEPENEADWLAHLKQQVIFGWRLTHKPDGRLIAKASPGPEAILSLAQELAEVADCTKDEEELAENSEVRSIVAQYHARADG